MAPTFKISEVELGGDMNSTAGSEPSHMHTRSDENYNRGHEWWLMEQSKLRNPNITLGVLAWGAPGWIDNGRFFSQDSIDYIVKFIQGAKAYHNLTIDYVGILDERPYDQYWIIQLKAALRAWNLPTKIVAADLNGYTIVTDLLANPALMDVVGFHYPRFDGGMIPLNKPIWATAHTNQFAGPGWQYIDSACGYLGSGRYVTLKKGSDFSLIVENVEGADTSATFNIAHGLSTGTLHVWKSDQNTQFVRQADIMPVNGSFTFYFDNHNNGASQGECSSAASSISLRAEVSFEQPRTVKLTGRFMGRDFSSGETHGYQLYLDPLGNWSLR